MNSIRTKIRNEKDFLYFITELKKLGALGKYICIGTSLYDTIPIDDMKYFNDGSDDSYVGINVSLENDYLMNTYPNSFHYKNP